MRMWLRLDTATPATGANQTIHTGGNSGARIVTNSGQPLSNTTDTQHFQHIDKYGHDTSHQYTIKHHAVLCQG